MVRPAGYAPASQHWQCRILLVDHGREKGKGAPVLDRFQCPGAPFIKMCGPTDSRQLIRLSPSAGPLFTIKNEHHYELLCSRTRRYFTADVSVFQAHLPCDSLSIFSYRIEPKPSVM